jgi:hypothetical protein
MKSAVDLPRVASRYCAPTDVPERNNCLPRIWTSVLLGSSENSRIMPSAYSFVLSLRSRSPMVGRLHPLSFILYPFKPHRVRDACPDKTCLSPFLAELPRFENSRNLEMTVYILPYRAARSLTRNPIFRLFGSGDAMSCRIASKTTLN